MSSILKNIEQKYAWSFIGVIIGIFFGISGLYFAISYQKKPNIMATIINEIQVVDVNENVTDLSILYRGKDIISNKQSLRIYTINIKNTGRETILKPYFDKDAPFGILMKDGEIIETPKVVWASSDYLKENFKFIITERNKVILKPIIFESNQEVNVKFVVLHNEDHLPTMKLIGKIAHVTNYSTEVVSKYEKEERPFYGAFKGSIMDQAVRLIIYPLIFFSILIIVILFLLFLSRLKIKRRKIIFYDFINEFNIKETKVTKWIYFRYIEDGFGYLVIAHQLCQDQTKMQDSYENLISSDVSELSNDIDLLNRHRSISVFRNILNYGLVTFVNDQVDQNKELKNILEKFIYFMCANYPKNMEGYNRPSLCNGSFRFLNNFKMTGRL